MQTLNLETIKAVTDKIAKTGNTYRLSEMFIKMICGQNSPTEELRALLKSRGYEANQATGIGGGGWDIGPVKEQVATLFSEIV